MNQKQIEAGVSMMRIFLIGLVFNFNANFHELKEIADRALGEIESEAAKH